METAGPSCDDHVAPYPLKPSLVEWKLFEAIEGVLTSAGLETFLGGMETGITDHNDITQLTP